MKPYPYQNEAITHAVNMLSERNNSLIVAPTGAGKTIMLAESIGRYFRGFKATHKRSPHILVLVHRTEIHTQNHSKFSLVCPGIATSEITSARKSLCGNVHFGMVQTVVNLLGEFEKSKVFFDLIVIDEAHHAKASTYEEIINWNLKRNPSAALLGVTATPNRGDKLPLIHLYDNYYQITFEFLINSHYLVRPTFIDLSPVFMLSDGEEKGHLSKNLKFDEKGLELIRKLCDDYLAYKEPGKSIIFAPSHEFCKQIYKRLKELGRNPAYLSLGLDDESRRNELERFEKGDCEELINVDICTEGYDFGPLRNLVDFDTNGTHGQWVQKVGRVLRTAPGKTSCTVIDFGGNSELYPNGLETDVMLEGAFKKKRGKKLSDEDLFLTGGEDTEEYTETEERQTEHMLYQDFEEYTPYHLPPGFESVNDKKYGIVFIMCGITGDCIVVPEQSGLCYFLYCTDKENIEIELHGTFDECVRFGIKKAGAYDRRQRSISNMQIKLLAPEYPTTALDWYGANCCICWKTWKQTIEDLQNENV